MTVQPPRDDEPGKDVVPSGHASGGELERFENPGLPDHRHRLADVDAKAAKRAELQVAILFGLSALGTLLFIFAYYTFTLEGDLSYNAYLGRVQQSNLWLGIGMFLSLFGIGAAAVHWAKTLMPDEERIEYRHPMRGTDEDRSDALAILREGSAESGLGRRPLIRNSMIGALGLVAAPAVVLLRDTGPLPGNALAVTFWEKDMKLIRDPNGGALKASDLTIGSVAHVLPEGIEKSKHPLEEKAKAAVLLMRLDPSDLDPESAAKGYQGIVAYSKICTHMGCPVALYEQQTHHLLCPCHQSTFDVTQSCKVIFGPAKRALPQLAITVDADGYLVAQRGFDEPVGPSYFERG